MQPTSLKQKIVLVMLGLFLSVVLLEISLRIGGFVILSLQEYRNRASLQKKGAYTIMCLGESTTQGKWPPYLEEILSQCNTGIKFSVIDEGIAAVNTSVILAELESNLNKYHPDMVIIMMGINDGGTFMPYEAVTASKSMLFFRSFRTYKLIRLLWLHIVTKVREIGASKPRSAMQSGGELEKIHTNTISSLPSGDLVKKTMEQTPIDYESFIQLGVFYKNQGKFSQAEESFAKATALAPRSDRPYIELGKLYLDQAILSKAKEPLKKAIELNPSSHEAYIALGKFYRYQGKCFQAEELYKKGIELNPEDYGPYIELGLLYQNQGKLSQAEELLKKAIEISPNSGKAYLALIIFYREQGKLAQVEELFKNIIGVNTQYDIIYGALEILYEEDGKLELAKEYKMRAESLRLNYYNPMTTNNFLKLKEILDKRGIQLVCVQYPMRSIEPLKKIFQGQKGIILVDNEKVFRDVLKNANYDDYFVDSFGGDFGHCTPKGNRLLAENIANVITKEILKK